MLYITLKICYKHVRKWRVSCFYSPLPIYPHFSIQEILYKTSEILDTPLPLKRGRWKNFLSSHTFYLTLATEPRVKNFLKIDLCVWNDFELYDQYDVIFVVFSVMVIINVIKCQWYVNGNSSYHTVNTLYVDWWRTQ